MCCIIIVSNLLKPNLSLFIKRSIYNLKICNGFIISQSTCLPEPRRRYAIWIPKFAIARNIYKLRKAIGLKRSIGTSDLYVVIKVCISPRRCDKFFDNFDVAGLWVSLRCIYHTAHLNTDYSPSFQPRPSYFIKHSFKWIWKAPLRPKD